MQYAQVAGSAVFKAEFIQRFGADRVPWVTIATGILVGAAEQDGRLNRTQRNKLLAQMTDDVASLVLRNNYLQTQSISMMEARLEAREKTLRAQFSAMEELVSGMNAQSSFLAQQMLNMPKIGGNS